LPRCERRRFDHAIPHKWPKHAALPRRTVVTGGAGFIGSQVCDSLLLRGDHVICVDDQFSGSLRNIRPLLSNPQLEHDVSEPLEIDGGVDRIYNLACPASPGTISAIRSAR
jgi:nucleoside-diphosphate-sugar epimerase